MTDIRLDDDNRLDEVVSDEVAHAHPERMDVGHWWLRLDLVDGGAVVVDLRTRRGAEIVATAEQEEPWLAEERERARLRERAYDIERANRRRVRE